ncbi:10957_t:CDS:10 [Diversispora eburnea]|uniref:Translation initiation factor eIF2B subunit gamma n=1 Tax=Diversispora eburnea TaxID=1213867 RepID=A0A9N8ZLZ6_9GLOM|nr:10957_t:CDS:10 [Diversispora eburnea]
MTRTPPRRIPRRRDSSRQAAFTFLSNISLGTESSFPPRTTTTTTTNNTQRATAIPSHTDPSPYNSLEDKLISGNSSNLLPVQSNDQDFHDSFRGNGKPNTSSNTKFDNNIYKTENSTINDLSDISDNQNLRIRRLTSNSLRENNSNMNNSNMNNSNMNNSNMNNSNMNNKNNNAPTSFVTKINCKPSELKLTHFPELSKENMMIMTTSPLTSSPMKENMVIPLTGISDVSTLKSETSSSSANSMTTPVSPQNNHHHHDNDETSLSRRKPNQSRSNLFSSSSAPLGIFSILGYNDKKSRQKNRRDQLKQLSDMESERRKKAESYAHLLTPSNSLGSQEIVVKVTDYYDPTYLDNPELKTEKQSTVDSQDLKSSSKHRTVLSLSGFMGSLMHHNTRPSDLKRESNAIFRQAHPEVDPSLTLSQIRKIKTKLLIASRYEDLDLELSTVAKAYAYFEKLILKGRVTKHNRKLIGAICLLLASKVNEPMGISYSPLLESLHKHLELTTKEIIEQEFSVFSSLEFELYLPPSEFMPHFDRIFNIEKKQTKQKHHGRISEFQAIILAGYGHKLYPLTEENNVPKALLPNVYEGKLKPNLEVIKEDIGTADALRLIKDKIKCDFIVISCDLITELMPHHFLDYHRTHDPTFTALYYEPQNTFEGDSKQFVGIDSTTQSRLIYVASGADLDEEFSLRMSLLWKFPRVNIHTTLQDSHVYIFKRWVIDLIVQRKAISSVCDHLVPLLVKCQYQKLLLEKEGIDKLANSQEPYQRIAHEYSTTRNDDSKSSPVRCQVYIYRTGFCSRAEIRMRTQVGSDSLVGDDTKIDERTPIKRSTIGAHYGCTICNGAKIMEKSQLKDCIVGGGFIVEPETQAKNEQL